MPTSPPERLISLTPTRLYLTTINQFISNSEIYLSSQPASSTLPYLPEDTQDIDTLAHRIFRVHSASHIVEYPCSDISNFSVCGRHELLRHIIGALLKTKEYFRISILISTGRICFRTPTSRAVWRLDITIPDWSCQCAIKPLAIAYELICLNYYERPRLILSLSLYSLSTEYWGCE